MQNSKGISYVYSHFKDGGALPISLILEQNGFERYVEDGEKSLLNYSPNTNGGGGKAQKICYLCGKHAKNKMHLDQKNSDYHKFKVAKYLLIADFRDRGMVKNLNPSKSAQLVSKPENRYGENIKVIIGTDITKEGLDFQNIRNVHLIESWYNLSKHEQIIGRAIRYCSHVNLPENDSHVTIYQYTSST